MLRQLKTVAGSLKTNVSGASVAEKLLVIESDDWGAIRMPDSRTLDQLKQQGIDLTLSQYAQDGLETDTDLVALFEMLRKYKDRSGNHPLITANTIVANPDFTKIQASGFSNYHYQDLGQLVRNSENSKRLIELYLQGNKELLFRPQFHGREHLNFKRWLQDLKTGNKPARACFDAGFTSSGKGDYAYMEAFDWTTQKEVETHKEILKDGLSIFKKTFGFPSKSFIPPCYTLDSSLEPFLIQEGVEIVQGTRSQLQPTGKFDHYKALKRAYGRQPTGMFYSVRNVYFEPCISKQENSLHTAIQQIGMAFLMNKPAVVCSHRVNYTSRISEQNRKRGLEGLEKLIQIVLKKWPEVKFISTEELVNY